MHYRNDNSYLFVNGIEILKFKATNKNANYPTQFFLGDLFEKFDAVESRERIEMCTIFQLITMLLINLTY